MCHGSVGLVARALEAAGIATVSVGVRAFLHRFVELQVPRAVITPHPMGRTIGPVDDRVTQRRVVDAGLSLLEGASAPGTFVDLATGQ